MKVELGAASRVKEWFAALQLCLEAIDDCSSADLLRGSGHYITGNRISMNRRTLVEVNHNKAITKKLVSAVHYQQVGTSNMPLEYFYVGRPRWTIEYIHLSV